MPAEDHPRPSRRRITRWALIAAPVTAALLAASAAVLLIARAPSGERALGICRDSVAEQVEAHAGRPLDIVYSGVEVLEEEPELEELLGEMDLDPGVTIIAATADIEAEGGLPRSLMMCVVEFEHGEHVPNAEMPPAMIFEY